MIEVLHFSHNVFLFEALLKEERMVLKTKTAPDMDNHVEKSDLLEVVSDLSQGVLGLKNLCAQQSIRNSQPVEV